MSIEFIKSSLLENIDTKTKTLTNLSDLNAILQISNQFRDTLIAGNKLFFCGNGGSASDSQHLATELVVRLRPDINRIPLPCISLTADATILTAIGNDYGFENIFSRQLKALAVKGDMLTVLSTSGNSPNILQVLKCAKDLNLKTVGMLGGNGGEALSFCDYSFISKSHKTARIQEMHISVGHIIMELVENSLIDLKYINPE
jgi:D-sedoheptulose 7-phosphate isomerase